MEKKLAEILGRNPETTTEEEMLSIVERMKFELDAKMGYMSVPFIEKLKRDGHIRFNENDQSWNLRMSDHEFRAILKETGN